MRAEGRGPELQRAAPLVVHGSSNFLWIARWHTSAPQCACFRITAIRRCGLIRLSTTKSPASRAALIANCKPGAVLRRVADPEDYLEVQGSCRPLRDRRQPPRPVLGGELGDGYEVGLKSYEDGVPARCFRGRGTPTSGLHAKHEAISSALVSPADRGDAEVRDCMRPHPSLEASSNRTDHNRKSRKSFGSTWQRRGPSSWKDRAAVRCVYLLRKLLCVFGADEVATGRLRGEEGCHKGNQRQDQGVDGQHQPRVVRGGQHQRTEQGCQPACQDG